MSEIYDFVIIGSGFGGSVSAMRLTQKGYKVAMIEKGKAHTNSEFPKSNWDVKKYLWAPLLNCYGIQKITFLKKLMLLHGVGVGGGSLVYANVLMQPEDKIFESSLWPKHLNWVNELKRHYETAKKMLGVTVNPHLAENDLAIKRLGEEMGVANTFHPTEVGIFFGEPDKLIPDPFFNGDGPDRKACVYCGSCMIGCPNGAKNTLDKNYLYFARKFGVKIFSELEVTRVIPQDNKQYEVETVRSTTYFRKDGPTFRAKKVIFAGGVLGTVELLLKNRDVYKTLPKLSARIGLDVRSNGESLLGATSFDMKRDFSKGIAIGAAIHPDEHTKIEGVRYPRGSDLLRFLAVPLTGEGNMFVRPVKMVFNLILGLPKYLRLLFIRDWAKSTVILLVMQSIESKINLKLKRSFFNLWQNKIMGDSSSDKIPSFLPVAQTAAKILGKAIGGVSQNISSEVILETPASAHILGGALIGNSDQDGVVDSNHKLFNYEGLYVCDGSVIPSNLAVNPSLTVTALSERFSEQFPVNIEAGVGYKAPVITFTKDKVK